MILFLLLIAEPAGYFYYSSDATDKPVLVNEKLQYPCQGFIQGHDDGSETCSFQRCYANEDKTATCYDLDPKKK